MERLEGAGNSGVPLAFLALAGWLGRFPAGPRPSSLQPSPLALDGSGYGSANRSGIDCDDGNGDGNGFGTDCATR